MRLAVGALVTAAGVAAMSLTPPSARLGGQELARWVEQQGGSTSGVVVGPTSHGLGLLASDDISKGECVVSVPSSCLLSSRLAQDSPSLQGLIEAVPADAWYARLALVLLAERAKGDDSSVAPYVSMLPAAYTVPLFWPTEAISQLQYPTVQTELLRRAKFTSSFAADRLKHEAGAFGGRAVDADALGWAMAACSSRAIRVGGGERALCPLIDLGNHATKGVANCEVRGTLGGALQLVAVSAIRMGEEVTFSYGSLSNDDFLLDYGFVPDSNPHDDVKLAWADGDLLTSACAAAGVPAAKRSPWQRTALKTALPPSLEQVSIGRSGVDANAMAACRIALAPDAAALRAADGGRRPLAPAAEVKALKVAAAMCAVALAGLPSGEEEQQQSEAASASDSSVALALSFLEEKRSVCTEALGATGDRIKARESGEARAALRGTKQGKVATGVRKKSAARGGAREKRSKPSGFGGS